MNSYIDSAYWISIAHLPKWSTENINKLIIQVVHDKKMSWSHFFELPKQSWNEMFGFSDQELADLENAKNDLPRIAFIAEQLQNEGFQVIPINSPDYPATLKENLKAKYSPPVLYVRGRKSLLQEDGVAIVGSRKAANASLEFTDLVARKSVKEIKLVVSGFAKGVDQQALDSALEAGGKSIIILPQGILTFQSGFKKYYRPIVNGNLLVLSTFFPKAGWEVGLAMARNAYIYGLAKEIYVAESGSTGGTWEGVMDGLKRKRKIYVRMPGPMEENANLKLIGFGAIPVNNAGVPIDSINTYGSYAFEEQEEVSTVNEPTTNRVEGSKERSRDIEKEILELLKTENYSAKEIILTLKLDWESRKLSGFLKKNKQIKTLPGKPIKYGLNNAGNLSLFN